MNSSLFRRARTFRALFGVSMLALSGAALSAPTLVGTTTNASGIDGVIVAGSPYDVTFSTSSFDSTFSTMPAAFYASSALGLDLDILGVTGLSFGKARGFDCGECLSGLHCVVFAGSSSQLPAAAFVGLPGNRVWVANGEVFSGFSPGCPQTINGHGDCFEAAHWTKVPELATLALFGLGLVGVRLSRRRLAR